MMRVADKHPALAIKEACLARSGVYNYTYDEMIQRGFTPAVKKMWYTEYRPKEVIERCKDKFAFAVVTKEHTPSETDPDNFRLQASGIIGENIIKRELEGGEIGIFGKMAFYTKDSYEYYLQGNKETSADYRSVAIPDITGQYDFILKDILSVNGVVITARGRGGPQVRVQDKAPNISFGGINMAGKKGVLSFLGIGRTKDEGFSFSKIVLEGARTLHTLDAAGKEKLVGDISAHMAGLPDGDAKDILSGAVQDALTHPVEALLKADDVARVLDQAYADAASVTTADDSIKKLFEKAGVKTQDAAGEPEKKEEGKKEEGKKTTDSKEKTIEEMFAEQEKRITDSIAGMIEKAVTGQVKTALGIKGDEKSKEKEKEGTRTEDGVDTQLLEDGAFILGSALNRG